MSSAPRSGIQEVSAQTRGLACRGVHRREMFIRCLASIGPWVALSLAGQVASQATGSDGADPFTGTWRIIAFRPQNRPSHSKSPGACSARPAGIRPPRFLKGQAVRNLEMTVSRNGDTMILRGRWLDRKVQYVLKANKQ